MGEIGNTLWESGFNPPDGYYFWDLNFGVDGWEYWILANNETIALYNSSRGGGPAPTPSPFPQVIVYGTIVAVLGATAGIGLLIYFKMHKR